jgi:membrane protein YqaA with SNARE-associated domain
MSALFVLTVAVLAAVCGACCGWMQGRQYGRNEQWVDDLIEAGKRDRERRDARGRFARRCGLICERNLAREAAKP